MWTYKQSQHKYLTVRITKNYGTTVVYPVCKESRLLAKLAGTTTLTAHAMSTIRELGYQLDVRQEQLEMI